jgi:hypothetical protein
MGLGVSLFLVAVGAILTWAVTADVEGVDVQVVGVILMVVGLAGLLLSLPFWSSRGGPGYFRRRTYVADAPPPTRAVRREVVEEDVPPPPA